jgi:hypothetical protein
MMMKLGGHPLSAKIISATALFQMKSEPPLSELNE